MNDQALMTDLYQLTMAAAYFKNNRTAPATFSLFVRAYPIHRGYFMSAGLEDVLDFLELFRFSTDDLEYLASLNRFSQDFLNFLEHFKFSGDVFAIPEGRLFFKDEPVIELTGPIIEAQLAESMIINIMNLSVSVSTKAARCVHASGGIDLIDFSMRRTHGTDAALKVARSSYLAGFEGTSNVMAGRKYGIPVSGTMAHSFVTSFDAESDAFRAFADTFPDSTVLLIDTFDTIEGARKAAIVAREMAERGHNLAGVRLDSGNMAELSKEVRSILDEAGLKNVEIFASGNYDEYKLADVLRRGAKIDAFGVGTKMGTSADAPYTDMAYKLVQYDGRPVLKLSPGKKTLVSKKQVFRRTAENCMIGDIIALRNEKGEGEPLLKQVMKGGIRQNRADSLADIRERFRDEFSKLDEKYKAIRDPEHYPVTLSPELENLQQRVVEKIQKGGRGE